MAKSKGLRTDIQGLRAVAVAAVVVYHLWPNALPGGYVGVDVFLVISGFLITTHLLQSPPRRIRDLGRFWGRRVRRLLPTSAAVIVTTTVIAWFVLPPSRMLATAREAITSALYVQNWELANSANDYLAAADEASPFRHFWTLSVEEQFYLFWPVLLALTIAVALRIGAKAGLRSGPGPDAGAVDATGAHESSFGTASLTPRTEHAVFFVVALVCVASFSYSVFLTQTNPEASYYVTPTRMWELAAGGLIAVAARRYSVPTAARSSVALIGLALIAVAAYGFSATTAFPGFAAALPVTGAAAVIIASSSEQSLPGRLLRPAPMQFVGDISYALYLWHWPLIVFAPFVIANMSFGVQLAIIALAIGLATATKYTVEDPVRFAARFTKSGWATAGLLAACTGLGAVAGAAVNAGVTLEVEQTPTGLAAAKSANPDCFGAGSVLNDCGADHGNGEEAVAMSPAYALNDRTVLYDDGCWNNQPYETRNVCEYGPDKPELRVALVGNSHAGHWFPALEEIAQERDWSLTTYLTSICYPVDVPIEYEREDSTQGCSDWNAWVRDEVVAEEYDLIIMSSRTEQDLADVGDADKFEAARESYGRVLDQFKASGADIFVIRDTTYAGFNVPDCVAVNGADECTWSRDQGLEPDPQAAAAYAANLPVLDLTDVMCGPTECQGVIGGVIVYFDHGHLTHTFAETLQPQLAEALDEVVLGTH